ncbi:MAG: phosphoribosylglycinamide formyltransferase [Eubacteriales bacterium]|nr:phosphoribosylglycinamide formyltransferase [Eubacteriales bacterium]
MVNIAVFISGGGTDLQSIIDAEKSGFINGKIQCVISSKKDAYGLTRAAKADIPAFFSRDNDEIEKLLEEYKIDLIVLAGYLAIIPDRLIKKYPDSIINIHPALIPSFCGMGYYGMHVHEAAFKKGVKVAGATVHFVSNEVDGGPIILQEACDVSKAESPYEMQQMVLEIEHRILPLAVKYYCNDQLVVKDERVIIK